MEAKLIYRGRAVTEVDLRFLRELIAGHPGASRRRLSILLCQAWGWVQPNGQRCEILARGLMLALHRACLLELPPVRMRPPNNAAAHRRPALVEVDRSPLAGSLGLLRPLEIRQVRRTPQERLFDGLIEQHHYLGYTRPVGEHLKYVVLWLGRPLACLGWGSPPRHLGPRDRFIGWSPEARRRNLRCLAYNTRFLILPWVRVPHLASHLLGRMARQLSADWTTVYGHPIHYLETFIDPARFAGTCYRAANWIWLGLTTGRGHNARPGGPRQPKKEVLGYPLRSEFREILSRME